jgi:hypothetical protein
VLDLRVEFAQIRQREFFDRVGFITASPFRVQQQLLAMGAVGFTLIAKPLNL